MTIRYILCVLFLCTVILICVYILKKKVKERSEYLPICDIYDKVDVDNIKNLDILFFSGNGDDDNLIRWWLDIDFSHVCICVVIKEHKYVLETDIKHHTRLIRISDKLAHYKGHKIIGVIPANKDISSINFKMKDVKKFIKRFKYFDKLYIPKRLLGFKPTDCCCVVQSFLEWSNVLKTNKYLTLKDILDIHKYCDFYEKEITYFSF